MSTAGATFFMTAFLTAFMLSGGRDSQQIDDSIHLGEILVAASNSPTNSSTNSINDYGASVGLAYLSSVNRTNVSDPSSAYANYCVKIQSIEDGLTPVWVPLRGSCSPHCGDGEVSVSQASFELLLRSAIIRKLGSMVLWSLAFCSSSSSQSQLLRSFQNSYFPAKDWVDSDSNSKNDSDITNIRSLEGSCAEFVGRSEDETAVDFDSDEVSVEVGGATDDDDEETEFKEVKRPPLPFLPMPEPEVEESSTTTSRPPIVGPAKSILDGQWDYDEIPVKPLKSQTGRKRKRASHKNILQSRSFGGLVTYISASGSTGVRKKKIAPRVQKRAPARSKAMPSHSSDIKKDIVVEPLLPPTNPSSKAVHAIGRPPPINPNNLPRLPPPHPTDPIEPMEPLTLPPMIDKQKHHKTKNPASSGEGSFWVPPVEVVNMDQRTTTAEPSDQENEIASRKPIRRPTIATIGSSSEDVTPAREFVRDKPQKGVKPVKRPWPYPPNSRDIDSDDNDYAPGEATPPPPPRSRTLAVRRPQQQQWLYEITSTIKPARRQPSNSDHALGSADSHVQGFSKSVRLNVRLPVARLLFTGIRGAGACGEELDGSKMIYAALGKMYFKQAASPANDELCKQAICVKMKGREGKFLQAIVMDRCGGCRNDTILFSARAKHFFKLSQVQQAHQVNDSFSLVRCDANIVEQFRRHQEAAFSSDAKIAPPAAAPAVSKHLLAPPPPPISLVKFHRLQLHATPTSATPKELRGRTAREKLNKPTWLYSTTD